MEGLRIVVIVTDGLVQRVLCSEPKVQVDVLDMDVLDDEEAERAAKTAHRNYEREVTAGTLHTVG